MVINTTKCTFFGPPGSGKSTLLNLIRNPNDKIAERQSTAVAEKAVQATTAKLVSTDSSDPLGTWVEFDSKLMNDILSNCVEKGQYHVESSSTQQTLATETKSSGNETAKSKVQERENMPAGERLQMKLQKLRAARQRKTKGTFKEIDLIYLVDTGGQPQFQEIVPLFVRNASVNAIVLKLSEYLRDFPKNTYWIHGREFSIPEDLKLTNKDLILHAAHSIYSGTMHRTLSTAEESPEHPSVLLVGMFADGELKDETHIDKHRILQTETSLKTYMDLNWLITVSRGKYIVDIDGSQKWLQDESEKTHLDKLKKLRTAILTQSKKLRVKVPLSWFLFLEDLQENASTENIMTLEECIKLGREFDMSEKNVQAALEFLDELNIILYYSKYLPGVVFCEPQFLLQKVTDIIVASFPLAAPDCDPSSGSRERFRAEGIFRSTDKFLQLPEFTKGFSDDFSEEDLLYLMQELLIIAKVDETSNSYFMPCVLPYEDPANIQPYDSQVDPLWIYFMQEHTPRGLFCAAIVHLTKCHEKDSSFYQWIVKSSTCRERYIRKRNIMEFILVDKNVHGPGSSHYDTEIGRVKIAATLSEFQIHTNCSTEHLLEIRANVESALQEAKEKLIYDDREIDYTYGFQCKKCSERPLHVAKVANSSYTICKCAYGSYKDLDSKQAVWFTTTKDKQHQGKLYTFF